MDHRGQDNVLVYCMAFLRPHNNLEKSILPASWHLKYFLHNLDGGSTSHWSRCSSILLPQPNNPILFLQSGSPILLLQSDLPILPHYQVLIKLPEVLKTVRTELPA